MLTQKLRFSRCGLVLKAVILFLVIDLLPCQAQTSKSGISNTPEKINVKSLIDSLMFKIDKSYILHDKAVQMCVFLKQQYKANAYDKFSNPFQLGDLILKDINKVYNDKHFGIRYMPPVQNAGSQPMPSQEERAKQVAIMEKENNYMFKKVEILTGNVGYLRFDGFVGNINEAKATLEGALSFVKNTKALIIDMRNNMGGSPDMVKQVESYFFKDKTHTLDIVSTEYKDTLKFYTEPENTNGLLLTMPIYILTSKNTASGAEDFSYAMKCLKRAKLVGDTTTGAANGTGPFHIGQGFIAFIPTFRPINPITLKDWEGTGVYPDYHVKSIDALEKAQEVIIQDLIGEAKTPMEKNTYQWLLNNLKANSSEVIIEAKKLEQCTGNFMGGLNFYVENGSLICKNAERGGAIYKLKPIKDMFFVLDENVQVEFIKSADGKVSGIKMYWKQGMITEKEKI